MTITAEGTARSPVRSEWRACVAAFTFLTRIPAYHLAAHDASDLPASSAYFPFVGLVVAAVGALAYAGAAALWPAPLAVVLSVASTVWITGAFHEDAAADSFDGFGGGWDREQVLTIMKDSRVGSYALVGVLLLLFAKVGSLSAISPAGSIAILRALIAGHVLGRWSGLPLIWRYRYVRRDDEGARPSAGKPFVAGVTTQRAVVTTLFAFAVVIAATGWKSPVAIGVAAIVTALGGRYAQRRIGGITGDVLGAVNQFVELSTYLVLAARPVTIG
jgi:adenosylcobinamide-GDP ribazoletransferase